MGRSPCCDKTGVKKGPWTPEEDIILVSYIQQHGPGNWKAIPTNAGLVRCSKSCRLRWTNYLRPGIKRGGFTEHEEKMIIHLQALLGNRWAAIASYLSQRTDNDIKNYWNTHLKKKLRGGGKQQAAAPPSSSSSASSGRINSRSASKGQWERRLQTDINTAREALCEALSIDKSHPSPSIYSLNRLLGPGSSSPLPGPATYASSAENIARLLENWTKKSPNSSVSAESATTASLNNNSSPSEGAIGAEFGAENYVVSGIGYKADDGSKRALETQMPFSALENWLLDDAVGQGHDGDFMDMASLEATTADLF